MQYFVSLGENSFYNDINKLEAASYIVFDQKEFLIKKYYKINTYKRIHDEETALKDIEELLYTSIENRLVSDVEVGTLLSGGIDSSLVSSLYSKISGKQINTFSVGYDEHEKYSELPYAKVVADDIGSNHHPLVISKNDFIDSFETTMDALEEPHADSAAIPLYCLTKKIKDFGVKKVLFRSFDTFKDKKNFFSYTANNYVNLKNKHIEDLKQQGLLAPETEK